MLDALTFLLRLRPALSAVALVAVALLAAAPVLTWTAPAEAQEEEARLLFERGNRPLTAGLRARGGRRTRELQQALDAYLQVMRLGARTRNVVFNLGITLQELERPEEAFNAFSEYLRGFELSPEDRAAGEQRLEALRPQVAVVRVESTPPGAEVRVDRRDLPPRGTTPLEIAVAPGTRRLILSREGYQEARAEATVAVGSRADVTATLEPAPVSVQFIAPGGGRLTLDDAEIVAGRAVEVTPGAHVVRLEVPGAPPVERRFEVAPGAPPMVLELSATAVAQGEGRVLVSSNVAAQVTLDGEPAGSGERLELSPPPGAHVLTITAEGHRPVTHRFSVADGETLRLRGVLDPHGPPGGLIAGRLILGVLALGGLATGVALLVEEGDAHAAWVNDYTDANADRLEAAQLAVDVTMGLTAALGVAALVLLFLDEGDSSIEVGAAPTPGGGVFLARGTWGER